MPKSLSDDLEEGEICDDEEIVIKQSNIAEYSNKAISERTNLTAECFQSSYLVSSGSLCSNNNLEIPYKSVVSSEINDDYLQVNSDEEEKKAEEDKCEDFLCYEVDEEDNEECFLHHKIMDMDESEDELKVTNFQDELVEYQSNSDDELDYDDKDNSDFSDEIVCSEGIIAANEFHSKMAALAMDTEGGIDRNVTANEDEMRTNLTEEVPVDDSWIFHSLDETPRIVVRGNETMDSCMLPESEGILKEQQAEMDLSKFEVMIDVTVPGHLNCADTETMDVVRDEKPMLYEGSNIYAKQIVELERKFAEEKENYVRNMYSLLVTARAQIETLKKENKKLEMKLQGNCAMSCPKCKHQICIRNNSLKPKYIKVLRGRFAIEMLFDNLAKMEEWLAANYLDVNPDELPVVLELPRKPTLTSTNSLLAPKTNSFNNRRNTDKVAPTSSTVSQNPGSVHPVATRQNMELARASSNFSKHYAKQHEKLNHMTRDEKEQERVNSSTPYDSCGKREKRSHARKRSGSDKYEEQQRNRILSTYPSPDRSFDHDQRQRSSFSKSRSHHRSRLNTKLNVTNCMTSTSDRKLTDRKDQPTTINNFGNRFESRSPSREYCRRPVKSPVCNRPVKKSSYQNCRNYPRSNRTGRSVEQKRI
uniref:Uncharacterized protein n=1 Tax=Loa loa TaxID=7209 RepID=A0A1I7VBH4_LOALO